MFAHFVLQPLEVLGEYVGKFLGNLYRDLPAPMWFLVSGLLPVFLFIGLLFCCGYSINLPFLKLQPTAAPAPLPLPAPARSYRQRIESSGQHRSDRFLDFDASHRSGRNSRRGQRGAENSTDESNFEAGVGVRADAGAGAGVRADAGVRAVVGADAGAGAGARAVVGTSAAANDFRNSDRRDITKRSSSLGRLTEN